MAEAVRFAVRRSIGVGSDEPYAYKIETGFAYHTGRLARKAGPNWYLRRALERLTPSVGPRMAKAMLDGEAAYDAEAGKIAEEMTGLARGYVVVVSGRLQRSLRPLVNATADLFLRLTGQAHVPQPQATFTRARYGSRRSRTGVPLQQVVTLSRARRNAYTRRTRVARGRAL